METNKKLFIWSLVGFILCGIAGPFLHMAYQWSGKSQFLTIFSPVNESTWENLKPLFWPALLFFLIEFLFLWRIFPDHIPVTAFSLFVGMLTQIAFFYTYQGILGHSNMAMNIVSYYVGLAVTFLSSFFLLRGGKLKSNTAIIIGALLYIDLIAMVILFTYEVPHIGLFLDQTTKFYGIQ